MDSHKHPLRLWREREGIGLREAAERLSAVHGAPLISHVSLGRIERGTQPPSIEVMRAVERLTEGRVGPAEMVAGYRGAMEAAE